MSQSTPYSSLMMTGTWISLLVVLALAFGQWDEKRNNPNSRVDGSSNDDFREVVLKANRQHHYVATGTINGRKVTFLLDTGATLMSIPEQLANEIGLPRYSKGWAETANGRVSVTATVVDDVRLGTLHWNDLRASINPSMKGDEVLLGMSALQQVEFTQRGDTLTLRQYR